MAKKSQSTLLNKTNSAKRVRKRVYDTVASFVEAFEQQLLENGSLQPAGFLTEANCRGVDERELAEILRVSKRLVQEGIHYRQRVERQVGAARIEQHKKRLLQELKRREG
jgi:hypothetical protein